MEVFQEIFPKTPYIELLSMLAYNPLGVAWATSEADNIIKRPPSSLYFQDFSKFPYISVRPRAGVTNTSLHAANVFPFNESFPHVL